MRVDLFLVGRELGIEFREGKALAFPPRVQSPGVVWCGVVRSGVVRCRVM